MVPRRGFNPFFIRASVYWAARRSVRGRTPSTFQSLLHQGISLLGSVGPILAAAHGDCFNPFFIRASVYCSTQGTRLPAGFFCSFNPFFIRASVYCLSHIHLPLCLTTLVSIPSSSGHQFTARKGIEVKTKIPQFQSLLHQGISLLYDTIVSDEQPDRVLFQSLLHQGISLLGAPNAFHPP